MILVCRACRLCVGYRLWEDGEGIIEKEGNPWVLSSDNIVLFSPGLADCVLAIGFERMQRGSLGMNVRVLCGWLLKSNIVVLHVV